MLNLPDSRQCSLLVVFAVVFATFVRFYFANFAVKVLIFLKGPQNLTAKGAKNFRKGRKEKLVRTFMGWLG